MEFNAWILAASESFVNAVRDWMMDRGQTEQEKRSLKAKNTTKRPPPTRRMKRSRVESDAKARPPRAGVTLWDDVIALKRDRIVQAAAALFYERGYRQATVDAIAQQMGATKPFVYYHFKSKTDLLVEICERATGDTLAATEHVMSMTGNPRNRLEEFVRAFTKVALERHQFVAVYYREQIDLPVVVSERIHAMRREIDARLRSLLNAGIATGDFDIDDPSLTGLIIAGMMSFAFAWYRDGGRLSAQEVTEYIVAMALRLVSPSSSHCSANRCSA
ncbi:MAG: TetR/AcrR family transcriptional regulator [Burkholderiaceae bacterium]|nr:TetR/AcrR family transcriptional regulator [Burkholderiaceae bacterium]